MVPLKSFILSGLSSLVIGVVALTLGSVSVLLLIALDKLVLPSCLTISTGSVLGSCVVNLKLLGLSCVLDETPGMAPEPGNPPVGRTPDNAVPGNVGWGKLIPNAFEANDVNDLFKAKLRCTCVVSTAVCDVATLVKAGFDATDATVPVFALISPFFNTPAIRPPTLPRMLAKGLPAEPLNELVNAPNGLAKLSLFFCVTSVTLFVTFSLIFTL